MSKYNLATLMQSGMRTLKQQKLTTPGKSGESLR